MSKRRSVILSVVLEGLSQADASRLYEVSEATVSRWVARYRVEGEAAFEPRSRRPKSSPARLADVVIELIVNLRVELVDQGLDGGAETIRWHLEQRHGHVVSAATIRRYLVAAGLVEPAPKKRPRSSLVRFEADLPNEMWQTDMTHVRLADGTDVEVLSWLDDHSRYALRVSAHDRVATPIVVEEFSETAARHGFPASVLSDNGLYFTTRFAHGGNTSRNRFETLLGDLNIIQKNSRPNHPMTCGKVERFQKTLKKWLSARPPAADLAQLQALLDEFVDEYNHRRPHTGIGRTTPAVAYSRLPKTGPATDPITEYRIRYDRVDKTGCVTLRHNSRLHHIGIGRAHAHTAVIMLINGLDIRIIERDTGEALRHLTLNPNRDYQPRFKT